MYILNGVYTALRSFAALCTCAQTGFQHSKCAIGVWLPGRTFRGHVGSVPEYGE